MNLTFGFVKYINKNSGMSTMKKERFIYLYFISFEKIFVGNNPLESMRKQTYVKKIFVGIFQPQNFAY
jgi:hypothetical protein